MAKENPEDIIVEEFSRSIVEFLRNRAEARGSPLERFSGYVLSDRFQDLNRKYEGKGPLYVGMAINRMIDTGLLRFNDDFYVLDKQAERFYPTPAERN